MGSTGPDRPHVPWQDLELLDLRNRPDEQLLQELYSTVYLANFTIPSEQEDPSVWRPRLWGAAAEPLELHVLVAGTTLDCPSRRQLYGAGFCELYLASACGLLTYLAVAGAYRGQGLARRLVAAGIARLQERARALELQPARRLRAFFSEVNDPTKISEDVMDPWARLRAFSRLGARIVPIPYVQPELIPGRGACRELLLLAWPLDERLAERVSAAALRDFLVDFYRVSGVPVPDVDADFREMAASIERLVDRQGADELPLVPIDAWLQAQGRGGAD